jgi:hypothetical protein
MHDYRAAELAGYFGKRNAPSNILDSRWVSQGKNGKQLLIPMLCNALLGSPQLYLTLFPYSSNSRGRGHYPTQKDLKQGLPHLSFNPCEGTLQGTPPNHVRLDKKQTACVRACRAAADKRFL